MKVYAINCYDDWDNISPIGIAASEEAATRYLIKNYYIYIGQSYWEDHGDKKEITQQDIDFILSHPSAEWCNRYKLFWYREYELQT